jgi:hypothetical protein
MEVEGYFGRKYSDSGKKKKQMQIDFENRVKQKLMEKMGGDDGREKGLCGQELIDYLGTGSYEYSVEEYDEEVHNLEKFIQEEQKVLEYDSEEHFSEIHFRKNDKIEKLFIRKKSRVLKNQKNLITEKGIQNYSPMNSVNEVIEQPEEEEETTQEDRHPKGDWLGLSESRNVIVNDRVSRSFMKTNPSSDEMSYIQVITPAGLTGTSTTPIKDVSQSTSFIQERNNEARIEGMNLEFKKRSEQRQQEIDEYSEQSFFEVSEYEEESEREDSDDQFKYRYQPILSELNFLEFQKNYKPKTWPYGT